MFRFVTMIFFSLFLSLSAYAQDAKPAVSSTAQQDAENAQKHAAKIKTEIDENMVTMSNLAEALSNNLGQLHYLRTLCFSDKDQKWRTIASEMMELEAPKDSPRRRQLIRAFNNGYYMQKERYTSCVKNISIDVAALSENGRRLSIMLSDPYREH